MSLTDPYFINYSKIYSDWSEAQEIEHEHQHIRDKKQHNSYKNTNLHVEFLYCHHLHVEFNVWDQSACLLILLVDIVDKVSLLP